MVRVSDVEEMNRKANLYKWKISDSFNSTTIKILLGWKVNDLIFRSKFFLLTYLRNCRKKLKLLSSRLKGSSARGVCKLA